MLYAKNLVSQICLKFTVMSYGQVFSVKSTEVNLFTHLVSTVTAEFLLNITL